MFFKRQGFRLFSVFTVLAVFFCTLAGYKTFVSADVYVPSNIKVGLFYGSSANGDIMQEYLMTEIFLRRKL